MALWPLPPPTQAIAGNQPPTLPYGQYLQALDKFVRALFASAPNVQASNYTLAAMDANGTVETTDAAANTLTVPLNAVVPFQIGTRVKVDQIGAGTTTITAASGVTIRNRSGLQLAGQYAVAQLYKRGTDEWVASGDLT